MATNPFIVLLRVSLNQRHANFLVLAPLGTLRDRAHPKSKSQNHDAGGEDLQVRRPPRKRTGFLFWLPELAFTFPKLRALNPAAVTVLRGQP